MRKSKCLSVWQGSKTQWPYRKRAVGQWKVRSQSLGERERLICWDQLFHFTHHWIFWDRKNGSLSTSSCVSVGHHGSLPQTLHHSLPLTMTWWSLQKFLQEHTECTKILFRILLGFQKSSLDFVITYPNFLNDLACRWAITDRFQSRYNV